MVGATQRATMAQDSSGEWTPTLLAPAHWYDFSDENTLFTDNGVTKVRADGDLICRVNNKGSASNYFAQSDAAKRPVYKTAQYNGKSAAVSTDALRDMVSNAGITITAGIFTVAVVFRISTASGAILGQGGYSNWLYVAANIQQRWDITANSTTGATSTTVPHIVVAVYNQANSELYLDGGTDKQANHPGTRGHSGLFQLFANGSNGLRMGAGSALCEIIIMPGVVISGANRLLLQSYFASKWGVTIT